MRVIFRTNIGLQVEGGVYDAYFTPGGLALYSCVYLVLMSIGAGLAIPGGLFMPSIVVSIMNLVSCERGLRHRTQRTHTSVHALTELQLGGASGGCWGILIRKWLPASWNVQPGLYALLAATGVLGGVFR